VQGVEFREHIVFLYDSWLITTSPILKLIYCESHRYEPWAIRGDERRIGDYPFPNVLYVDKADRAALLDEIHARLLESPTCARDIDARFRSKGEELLRVARRVRRGERSRDALDALVRTSAQVLSIGALKEMLEPDDVVKLLARFVPLRIARANVLDLFQPLCMPHFVKVEHALLFFAERFARTRSARVIKRAIDKCAHHSRFLLEPTELADARAMRARLVAEGTNAPAIRARRRALLRRHRHACDRSRLAQQAILRSLLDIGPTTLHMKQTLMGIIRTVQLVATWEELKHILAMTAAREIRRMLDDAGLAHTSTLAELERALDSR
jgi:hypothetical protein